MSARQRLDREARGVRDVRRTTPAFVAEPQIHAAPEHDGTSSIEFEDRSGKAYYSKVVEVVAALEWVHQRRAAGHLPS